MASSGRSCYGFLACVAVLALTLTKVAFVPLSARAHPVHYARSELGTKISQVATFTGTSSPARPRSLGSLWWVAAMCAAALCTAAGRAGRNRRSGGAAGATRIALRAEADPKEKDGIGKTVADRSLTVNLNPDYYGSFAEIGAGQEVSRWFLRVGAAAGTVARSVSAYDMQMSDRMYGTAKRYVTKERLFQMMSQEYEEVEQTLRQQKGEDCRFFGFASTIAAKAFMSDRECEGWLGIMYQKEARQEPSTVWLHARMSDPTAMLQGDALGILGANLVYLCMDATRPAETIVRHLMDDVGEGRVTINWVDFGGPGWTDVDNRVVALNLVQYGLVESVVFEHSDDGMVPTVPNLAFYKRPVLVQRGRFRFVSKTNEAIIEASQKKLVDESPSEGGRPPVPLLELTLDTLGGTEKAKCEDIPPDAVNDFIARFNVLSSMRCPILVSGIGPMHQLAEYLRRYSTEKIAIAVGGGSYSIERALFREEKEGKDLKGGLLEGFGKLFAQGVQVFVFPNISQDGSISSGVVSKSSDVAQSTLLEHLTSTGKIVPIEDQYISEVVLNKESNEPFRFEVQEILDKICTLDGSWKQCVPQLVVDIVMSRGIGAVLGSSMQSESGGGAVSQSPLEKFVEDFRAKA